MSQTQRSLSIKNKLLIVLATLPLISIAIIVAMSISVFKGDKLAYVYDTALSSTRAKSSTLKSQINSYAQVLRGLTINFNPQERRLSANGESFFVSEPELKAFYNFVWDGKKFKSTYNKDKGDYGHPEMSEIESVLQETWYSGMAIGVSKKYPMHF